jgi:recombination protein RecA
LDKKQKEHLDMVAASIRRRWGSKALSSLSDRSIQAIQSISSGFPSLDQALGIGGFPRGHISELIGTHTAGMVTVALKVIAAAQAEGMIAAYFDLSESLDADYARRCGVILNKLVLIRPHPQNRALEMLYDLVSKSAVIVAVFDSTPDFLATEPIKTTLPATMRRINRALIASGGALLFLTPSASGVLTHDAAVRLVFERKHWIHKHEDVQGYESQVMIAKNKFAPEGREVLVTIDFDEVVRGDAA